MRLTIKQLNTAVQQQFEHMTTRIQRSEYDRSKLHQRTDRILLRFDEFAKETRHEFATVNDRLDRLEKRFDAIDQRFSIIEQRFDELTHCLLIAFDAIHKKLNELK